MKRLSFNLGAYQKNWHGYMLRGVIIKLNDVRFVEAYLSRRVTGLEIRLWLIAMLGKDLSHVTRK